MYVMICLCSDCTLRVHMHGLAFGLVASLRSVCTYISRPYISYFCVTKTHNQRQGLPERRKIAARQRMIKMGLLDGKRSSRADKVE